VIVSRAELLSLVPPLPVADLAALLAVSLALLVLLFAFADRDDPLPEREARLLPEFDLALAPERDPLDPLDPFEDVRPRDEERFEDPR
jgi:hypothetical protein